MDKESKYKIHNVGGINVSLSDNDSRIFSGFLSKMSNIPDLRSMIATDENGLIVSFEPKSVSWGLIFFVQNLMIMQRLRIFDDFSRNQGLIK